MHWTETKCTGKNRNLLTPDVYFQQFLLSTRKGRYQTLIGTKMGEQPIYSTRAHVFVIEQTSKKNWQPASAQAISVSFFFDSSRKSYRVISVDGTKAIINSTVVPSMSFTKTSQKFGQWTDARANTIYGLGFASEEDLNAFQEKFAEVRVLAGQVEGVEVDPEEVTKSTSSDNIPGSPASSGYNNHTKSPSMSSTSSDGDRRSPATVPAGVSLPTVPGKEAQLKYENDRLKIALAQSSANKKKWEVELTTLRNNNARLTTALQESTANVEEWKRQLAAYKEEAARLKRRVAEQDSGGGAGNAEMQRQIEELRAQMKTLGQERDDAISECSELRMRLEEKKSLSKECEQLKNELATARLDENRLRREVVELQQSTQRKNMKLQQVLEQANARAAELLELQETAQNVLHDDAGSGTSASSAHR